MLSYAFGLKMLRSAVRPLFIYSFLVKIDVWELQPDVD